jgi:hypothetical protein
MSRPLSRPRIWRLTLLYSALFAVVAGVLLIFLIGLNRSLAGR